MGSGGGGDRDRGRNGGHCSNPTDMDQLWRRERANPKDARMRETHPPRAAALSAFSSGLLKSRMEPKRGKTPLSSSKGSRPGLSL